MSVSCKVLVIDTFDITSNVCIFFNIMSFLYNVLTNKLLQNNTRVELWTVKAQILTTHWLIVENAKSQ